MEKTIALDLGTNSIGWAIRDESKTEKQIIDAGVLTFDKGVAEVKGIETPKVSKRTESRGKRRNYQARKYRKQALLALLIENGMCPLTIEELDKWRKYDNGRRYPQQKEFTSWLRLDFNLKDMILNLKNREPRNYKEIVDEFNPKFVMKKFDEVFIQ